LSSIIVVPTIQTGGSMDYDQYIMLLRRIELLKTRNKEIDKKMLELQQEINRNKLEIEENYVKVKKVEEEMQAWQGVTHGKV